jgi:hypothetical protein
MLSHFIEHDRNQGDQSLCAFMYRYFLQDLPKEDYKVKVSKDTGKLTNDAFEMEDKVYSFGKWKVDIKKEPTILTQPRVIDYICK